MQPHIVQQLLDLNRHFYEGQAASFAQSRQQPQPGFAQLQTWLPQPCHRLLDVGCGNGRLGHFLLKQKAISLYTGVDFSEGLLNLAIAAELGNFHQRDLSQPDSLTGLGKFEAVVCLAALHHIPGQTNRARLLMEMKRCLQKNGRIILSTWQFRDSPRQQRKIRDWDEVRLSATDVEANDYLLTWQRGSFAYRYVCMIDEKETAVLAEAARLHILSQFRSDGKEGNLSLYTILA